LNTESINNEKRFFENKLQECRDRIPNLISRRQFNDRRKKTDGLCEKIRKRLAYRMDGGEDFFIVDSKPIEVCRVAMRKLCRMGRTGDFTWAPDFGFCTSQNTYYFGYKGYIGADVQLDLFQTAHIRLECPYRLNQKDWNPTFIPFAKARKRIETLFSQLADQFMVIRNYAKITNGLFARIIGKISALTVSQYMKYINSKPIGRIKYALK
jgi:hypothetical protein